MKRMILLLLSATLAVEGVDAAAQGYTGCIPLSRGEYENLPIAPLPSHTRSAALSSCFLKTPAVGNQGTLGSCTAWATAYAATGILAMRKYGREIKFSPSFLYNQIQHIKNHDTCRGTNVRMALTLLQHQGACRWEEMPYDVNGCDRQPTAEMHWSALSNRIKWGRLANCAVVEEYKAHLANGHPIVFNVNCTTEYTKHAGGDGYWCIYGDFVPNNYHAMCVVGYDDNKTYGGKRGFLKIMNSIGPLNGDNGFLWIAYDLVKTGTILEAYAVYDISPDVRLEGDGVLCSSGGTYHIENGAPEWGVHWEAGSKAQIVRQSGFAMEAKSVGDEARETDGYESIAARVSVPGEWPCEALGSKRVWTGVPYIKLCIAPRNEQGEPLEEECGSSVCVAMKERERASVDKSVRCWVYGGHFPLGVHNSNPTVGSVSGKWRLLIPHAYRAGSTLISLTCSNACGMGSGFVTISVEKNDDFPRHDIQFVGAQR